LLNKLNQRVWPKLIFFNHNPLCALQFQSILCIHHLKRATRNPQPDPLLARQSLGEDWTTLARRLVGSSCRVDLSSRLVGSTCRVVLSSRLVGSKPEAKTEARRAKTEAEGED
jgi:hypothetical protein